MATLYPLRVNGWLLCGFFGLRCARTHGLGAGEVVRLLEVGVVGASLVHRQFAVVSAHFLQPHDLTVLVAVSVLRVDYKHTRLVIWDHAMGQKCAEANGEQSGARARSKAKIYRRAPHFDIAQPGRLGRAARLDVEARIDRAVGTGEAGPSLRLNKEDEFGHPTIEARWWQARAARAYT